jgi:hypothetical protein
MVAGNVVIGPPKCEPLVGTQVLQDFRVVVDLENMKLLGVELCERSDLRAN